MAANIFQSALTVRPSSDSRHCLRNRPLSAMGTQETATLRNSSPETCRSSIGIHDPIAAVGRWRQRAHCGQKTLSFSMAAFGGGPDCCRWAECFAAMRRRGGSELRLPPLSGQPAPKNFFQSVNCDGLGHRYSVNCHIFGIRPRIVSLTLESTS